MNEDELMGKWKALTGQVKETWAKLTDDDIDAIQGRSDQLEGKLRERYGMARDEARRQVQKFKESL